RPGRPPGRARRDDLHQGLTPVPRPAPRATRPSTTGGPTMSQLDSLKQYTTVVADTGDIESIARYKPQDATTNPSLLFQAAQRPEYAHLGEKALGEAAGQGGSHESKAEAFMDGLFVAFGCEILEIVPGRVSTEVDAGLSFDTEGSIAKARRLINLYEQNGVGRERVLIKVASTWEGIRAAQRLAPAGI